VSDSPASRQPLLILGASARAAASSAARGGFSPIALDLFADRDLASRFPSRAVARSDYPRSLLEAARSLPDAPWIYTGGLENSPDLIEELARDRPLLGIVGKPLAGVRDPIAWTSALRAAGLPALDSRFAGEEPPTSGAWLRKSIRSTGGRGVHRWTLGSGAIPRGSFLQARRSGIALGAIFVGKGRSARLRGVTRQLLGRSAEGLRVIYSGSVGPWPLEARVEREIGRIGDALAGAFGLRGIFGVDLILEGETPWAVEINPRYSASVEVLEEALGLALVAEHARAFGVEVPSVTYTGPRRFLQNPGATGGSSTSAPSGIAPALVDEPPVAPVTGTSSDRNQTGRPPGAVAKRILFADRRGLVPADWPWTDPSAPWPDVADLPAPGTAIEPGDPVLTVFGRGATVDQAMSRLKARVHRWRRRIAGWPAP
jgi:predicted ATP-grasp superfamily ATP-dependent carboligase